MPRALGSHIALFCAVGLTSPAAADILLVNADGTGQYPTIQSALDAAVDGDEVRLNSGVFRGEGNVNLIMGSADILFASTANDPAQVTIEGDSVTVAMCPNGFSTIEAVTFTTAPSQMDGYYNGLVCLAGDTTILRCVFEGVHGTAISNYDGSPLIQQCVFRDNYSEYGASVMESFGGHPRIVDCTFENNGGYFPVQVECGLMQDCVFVGTDVFFGGGGWGRKALIERCAIENLTVSGPPCVQVFDSTIVNPIQLGWYGCYRIITTDSDEDAPLAIAPNSWGKIKGMYR